MVESKSFEAKGLYNEKNYDDIITLYKDLEKDYCFNEWDYYYYSSSLRKKGYYKEALKLSSECLKKHPNFNSIKYTYCWCLYHLYVKDFDYQNGDKETFNKAAKYILKHTVQETYSPFERTVWKVIKYLESKSEIKYEEINSYIDLLNPDLLSSEPKKVIKDSREMKIASDKEKWYSTKSKALMKLGKYEECIKISQEALLTFRDYHHNNDIWFNYKIAISKIELGNFDEAEEILLKLLRVKEHWVLYESLFTIYKKKEDVDKVLKYASKAALTSGEHKHKMNLYQEFSDFLKEQGMTKESYYHLLLIKKIREENSWKISNSLIRNINDSNIEEPDEIKLMQYLDNFWREYKLRGEEKYIGTIDKILPNGKSGFIKDKNGNSYYFKRNSLRSRKEELKEGLSVTFYIKEGYDKVKKIVSNEAVEIIIRNKK